MEIPITGIIFDTNDDGTGGRHSHRLFITAWDGVPIHVHEFAGITSIDVGHRHRYAGVTQAASNNLQHTHVYCTVTSFDDGHTHEIRGMTGPAAPIPGGGHYHFFQGTTTVNGDTPHTHMYKGRTGAEVSP